MAKTPKEPVIDFIDQKAEKNPLIEMPAVVTINGKPYGQVDAKVHEPPPHRVTLSGGLKAPEPVEKGMQEDYWVLSPEERAKGFVEPVRRSYVHRKCGGTTKMGLDLSETYARDPSFYGSTYCATCEAHFPVGTDGEFVWQGTNQKVGTFSTTMPTIPAPSFRGNEDPDTEKGLYRKYDVRRLNDLTGKHDGCDYFVLDLNHDPHAAVALIAYATSCRDAGYIQLADDLMKKVREHIEGA